MWLTLEPGNGMPLGRQIYQGIRSLVLRGDLAAGEKLPSSRALSKTLNVSRNTVLEAYDQLQAEGYLETRRGSGTMVAEGISVHTPSPGAEPHQDTRLPIPARKGNGVIRFRSGVPALDAFPAKEWGRLYSRACASLPSPAFQYCEPEGVWELREALAAYLLRVRGIRTAPERIMITSGSTQGLRLISRLLYRQGASALVEDPVHKGLVEVITRTGYGIRGIKTDEYGMDTAALGLLSPDEAKRFSFVYVTPSHQYPMGGILPIQRRQALIRFAQAAGILLVEDDYDGEFRYEGSPVSSLHELAPETVVYLGSFSKILAPALRLGYAVLPESLLERWKPEKTYTDVHTDAVSQYTLAAFIAGGGLERHLFAMGKLYKRKRALLLQCLAQEFGDSFAVRGQAAGLHLVAGFPGIDFTKGVTAALEERGVSAVPVESYSLCRDGAHAHELILGYSHLREDEIIEGAKRLGEALRRVSV